MEQKKERCKFLTRVKNFFCNYSFIIGLLIIIFGFDIYCNIDYICVTDESIVLVFVGILATFIVMGNYAQVVKIENDLKEEIQRTATKEARKVAADVIKQSMKNNKISIKDDDIVNLLVHMASTAKNILDRKEYLEAALEKCDNEEEKKKIQDLIDTTRKAIDNNYLPDIL